jgi:hypothetical protein
VTSDTVGLQTNVTVTVHDASTGEVLGEQRAHNLVVNDGLNLIRDLLEGTATGPITHFALGTDSTPVTASDTALGVEVFRDVLAGTTANAQQLVLSYYLNSADANGNTLSEAGLFNAASAGTMFARVALSPPIAKTAAVAVSFFWTINLGAA